MDNNNLLLWILIALGIYYFFFSKKETFSEATERLKSEIAKKIIAFINKDTTHAQYLDMLSNTDNPSYELLKPEVFYHFKKTATESRLVESDIFDYMKDI